MISIISSCRSIFSAEVDSTYRVMVGRSETITGPYVDRDGVEL